MSKPLQLRAEAFLARPVPGGISYVKNSIAERIISVYAQKGSLGSDPELAELLELCLMETASAIEDHAGDASAYFKESAGILESIQAELA